MADNDLNGPEKSEEDKFKTYMDVEYCRFCGRSGIYLGQKNGSIFNNQDTSGGETNHLMTGSAAGSSLLITPCSCLKRHCRYSHMPCLITWIHTHLSNRCPDCQTDYNCIHKVTPLREWRTNPSTDRMTGQYCSAFLLAILIGLLDGFVLYLIWLTVLPLPLKICVMILLAALYVAGLVAAYSRCAVLYHKLYIFNCPVVEVIPPKSNKIRKDDILALL